MKVVAIALLVCPVLIGQAVQVEGVQTRPRTSVPSTANAPDSPLPTVSPEDKCTIEGTVVSGSTGEPIRKVHLTLRPLGGQGQMMATPYGTTSDNAGHFLLNDIDPGKYILAAMRDGYIPQAYSPQGGVRQNSPITLAKGQKTTDLVFKLTPHGVVTGRVVDQDGDPLSRVQLQLLAYTYQRGKRQLTPAGSAMTNDLGEYRIFGIRPGKYIMSVRPVQSDLSPGVAERAVGTAQARQRIEEGYPSLFYPNALRSEGGAQIVVAAGAQVHGIDVTLTRLRTYHIKGKINTAIAPQRRRFISLMLMPRDAGAFMSMPGNVVRILDVNGNFDMPGVVPGSYILAGDIQEENQRFSARVPIDVGNANVEGVEVAFVPPMEVKGHFIVEDNGDLKGLLPSVNLQPKVDQPRMGGSGAQAKEDLSFVLMNLMQESYDFSMYGMPESFYIKSVRVGDQDITVSGLDFSSGVPAGEMVVVLNPNGGKVEGTVENAKGEKAVSASVVLVPDAAHRAVSWMYKTANTDQTGHFSLTGIKPGDYKIYAWEELDFGAAQDPEFMKPYESLGKEVTVQDGGHETVQIKIISRTDQ